MGKNGRHLFTSESVTEGHPDKIADQISDAVLDALLAKDPMSRVACETIVTTGLAFIAGEVTTTAYADLPGIVRETIKGVGYTRAKYGFDYETCAVISAIHEQSPDIAMGVDPGRGGRPGPDVRLRLQRDRRADAAADHARPQAHAAAEPGPQGRDPRLPAPGRQEPGHRRIRRRRGPRASRPSSSPPSTRSLVKIETIREDILEKVIHAVIPSNLLDSKTKYFINPTGRFVVGGPQGDCGLTGRKIIVDTYGGVGSHGGGAFSGKDPTKVDRSASYMARHIAKNIVAAGLADRLELQIAYAIGVAEPVSVMADTAGHGQGRRGQDRGRHPRDLPPHAQGHHRVPEPAAPHLQEDGRLRPLRPQRGGVHLGAHRQGRRPAGLPAKQT